MDGKVDQDVREAAAVVHAKWHDDGCPNMGGASYEEDVAILAFAAGRQAGLREAMAELDKCCDPCPQCHDAITALTESAP